MTPLLLAREMKACLIDDLYAAHAIERRRAPVASVMRLQEQRDAIASIAGQSDDLSAELAAIRDLFVAYVVTRDRYDCNGIDADPSHRDSYRASEFTGLQLELLAQLQSFLTRTQGDPPRPGDFAIRRPLDEYDRYLEWRFGERARSSLEDRYR